MRESNTNFYMQSLFEAVQNYKLGIKKRGDPLTDLIQEFQFEINKEAGVIYKVGEKKKKTRAYSFADVRGRVKHLSYQDLRYFMSVCKDYKNRHGSFRKAFFGALKVK